MSENVTYVTNLIEKAGKAVGTEYKLAQEMGLPQSVLTGWKSGRRICVPDDRARLAGFAREDAAQELIRATIEKNEGTLKGEQLKKLLGKPSHQTGEALNSALLLVVSLSCTLAASDIPRCILGVLRCIFRTQEKPRYKLC